MLDFRIATFLRLCETGSYTKTARLLDMTQPSVTQHIKYLQNKYQCRLFTYEGKMLRLTPEGEYLRREAEAMMHMSARVEAGLRRIREQGRILHFGVPRELGEGAVSEIVARIFAADQEMAVSVTGGNTDELLQQLESGRLDFVLADKVCVPAQMTGIPAVKVGFGCYAGRQTAETEPDVGTLLSGCLLLREEGASDRAVLERLLQKKGLTFNDFASVVISNMPASLHAMTASQMGVTFTYMTGVEHEQMLKLHLKDFSEQRSLVFVCRKDNKNNERYKRFFESFRTIWQERFVS